MALNKLKITGVMAPHDADPKDRNFVMDLGALIATLECNLLTGGGGGAMEAVCEGFTAVNNRAGRAIGIIPAKVSLMNSSYDRKRGYPNKFIEIPIYTHLHQTGLEGSLLHSRNHINALTPDVIVILNGGNGTLAEAHLAVRYKKRAIVYFSNTQPMQGLGILNIPQTNNLKVVEQYIQQSTINGPNSSFQPNSTPLPGGFHMSNF